MIIATSRYLDRKTGSVMKATTEEPVCITTYGKRTHVLLSFDAYQKLIAQGESSSGSAPTAADPS